MPAVVDPGDGQLGQLDHVNTIIEFHDSRVADIGKRDVAVIVYFLPAYLHISEGRPAFDPGTGWFQEARLIFADASVSNGFPVFPCVVMDGELVVDGERYENWFPVPLEVTKPTELRLTFDSIHTVTVIGRAVRLELLGDPKYVEEFK
jgi:hypothetical protein